MFENRMNTFSFHFDDLKINHKLIENKLGFADGLPEPFNFYFNQVWQFAKLLSDISAAYTITNKVSFKEDKPILIAENNEFNIVSIIRKELRNSEYIAFFICTAGQSISLKSKELMQVENACLGYVYDVMGTLIVEAVGDKLQEIMQQEVSKMSYKITNRYSPGYCQWKVEEQYKLFSIFPKTFCNVHLTS